MMTYGEKLMKLASLYDKDLFLSTKDRIHLYNTMLEYDELKSYGEMELGKIIPYLDFIKNSDRKTFYEKNHNVHDLCTNTVKVALDLIHNFGEGDYTRPAEFSNFSAFFSSLETHTFHAFCPKRLFTAVYNYAKKSPYRDELMKRISEEITESEGLCITGCIVRLVNVLRGYDDKFQVNLDAYETVKARTFYKLTKLINPYTDDILVQIENIVNSHQIKLPKKYALKILKAYTGESWIKKGKLLKLNFV